MSQKLQPGERIGVEGGWPPLSIVRDDDGRYYEERLSDDLKKFVRKEISEDAAEAWISQE